jgi:hypothetical protein
VEHDFTELSHLSFEFERDEISQKRAGSSRDLTTDRYALSHDLLFGKDAKHRLDSFLTFYENSRDSDLESLRWQERLKLQHTPSFLTNYIFSLSDTKQEAARTEQVRWQAGFEHRLYESLITRGSVFFTDFELEGQSETDQRGGMLGFNYRKKNPWGLLLGTYTASLVKLDQSGAGGTGVVVDESHIFLDPDNILLDERNIDTSTIIVTDNTGLITYIEGDDYTILPVGDRTELDINPFGSGGITNGQQLLIDYNFFAEEERQEDTRRQSLGLRQRFDNGLSCHCITGLRSRTRRLIRPFPRLRPMSSELILSVPIMPRAAFFCRRSTATRNRPSFRWKGQVFRHHTRGGQMSTRERAFERQRCCRALGGSMLVMLTCLHLGGQ